MAILPPAAPPRGKPHSLADPAPAAGPVIGLDISKGRADVFVSRGKLAVAPRDFYESEEFGRFHVVRAIDTELVDFLSALQPEMVVLEPTGAYSQFLVSALEERGIPFLLVNQVLTARTRKAFGGTDGKDDAFDSLLLAELYYEKWVRRYDRRFWLRHRPSEIRRMRTVLLDLKTIIKKSTAAKETLLQRLGRGEWLDKAECELGRKSPLHPDQLPALCAWIAGWTSEGEWTLSKAWNSRWKREFQEAEAKGEAAPFSDATRTLARAICLFHQTEARSERELLELLTLPQFAPYHAIFDQFGFGPRERGWLLAHVYPFEQFLTPDGKQEIDYSKTRRDGKSSKKNRSLRRFRQTLGVGGVTKSSGKSAKVTEKTGSSDARSILWLFVFSRIEAAFDRSGNIRKPDQPVSQVFSEARYYFAARAFNGGSKVAGQRLADARNATCRRIAELLFRELAKVFCEGGATGEN